VQQSIWAVLTHEPISIFERRGDGRKTKNKSSAEHIQTGNFSGMEHARPQTLDDKNKSAPFVLVSVLSTAHTVSSPLSIVSNYSRQQ
jgi:hypothetical protein